MIKVNSIIQDTIENNDSAYSEGELSYLLYSLMTNKAKVASMQLNAKIQLVLNYDNSCNPSYIKFIKRDERNEHIMEVFVNEFIKREPNDISKLSENLTLIFNDTLGKMAT